MKKRRILALVLALALCLALVAACGGNGSPGGAQPAPPAGGGGNGGDDNGEPEDNGGGEGEGTPAGEPIKIGILGPFTGAVAQYGVAVRDGALLYIEQFNAAGGLNGRPIEAVLYDDEHDSVQALTGYNSLVDQGVTAIIGGVTSGPTMAVVPFGFEDDMPMITASATHAGVTYDEESGVVYTNIVRVCFIDPFQGEKMADFAVNVLEASTAAVIFNTGVDYSIGLKDAFLEKAAAIGLEIVAEEAYAAEAVDFQSQLTNIAARNPDVLFVPDYYENVALLSQQAMAAGVTATLLGADGWDGVVGVMTDHAPVEGSFYVSAYSAEDTTPMVQDFLRDYMDKYGHEPNMFAAQGYDAAAILIAALAVAEATDHETGSLEYRLAVIDALRATNTTGVTGQITYDSYNNPIKEAVIINITGGADRFWGKY